MIEFYFCSCSALALRRLIRRLVPPFLSSLWTILEESEGKNCIVWTKDGEAFVITSPATLCQTILPKHFKHSNFQSFVRQLNVVRFIEFIF